jgi:hypothetical protein
LCVLVFVMIRFWNVILDNYHDIFGFQSRNIMILSD